MRNLLRFLFYRISRLPILIPQSWFIPGNLMLFFLYAEMHYRLGLFKGFIYKKEPEIKAIHAGLECGILGNKNPGMDMISFGPTIHGAHSPDEKANIPSAQKFWKFLLAILQHIPQK